MSRRTPRPFRPHVVRYYDAQGKRCAKCTPGAVRRKERLDTWYAKLSGEKISLETVDEGQAWERLRDLLRRRGERQRGLRDDYTDHAERPLTEHVQDWCAVLRAKGTGEKHVQRLRADFLRLAAAAGWG